MATTSPSGPPSGRPSLNDEQLERYARHIVLREVGGAGQAKLLSARVLVIGAGGLGSPLILYLAAAGVGTIGVVDFDRVSLSNLQRQIAHSTENVGRLKTDSARQTVRAINPDVRLIAHAERLTAANAANLFADYDIVADGSDNFATRFLLNDACYFAKKTLVSAAVTEFEGQLATYKGHLPDCPCYRCLFPEPPPPGTVQSCSETGVLGAAAGVMGSLQALEVLKEAAGLGTGLSGKILTYKALSAEFRTARLPKDPGCPLCGQRPTIRDISGHSPAA